MRIRRPASASSSQARARMTTMRNAMMAATRASASSSWKYFSKSFIGRSYCPAADATARASMQTQRGLDVAHHRDQARAEVVLELTLLHHERGHDAVEGDDLAVHRAAHRHADRMHLAAQLAARGAEAARADVLERLVDRRAVLAVRLRLLHFHVVQHRLALGGRAGGEEGAADDRVRDRHGGADVGQGGDAVAAAAGLDIDHGEAVADA